MDILEVMARRPEVCKYLDMPLQHGSDAMLKAMRRGITRQKTEELLQEIRSRVPGIAIRTTLIAGHPGETEADFEEMMRFVEQSRFERLGVFTYSHEDQTHSYSMVDDVPAEIKDERQAALMEIQQDISLAINQQRVGQTLKVLIDRKEGGYWVGRTEFDSPEVDNEVLIDASTAYLRQGDFAQIAITDAAEFDLYGTVVA
jgi:ribosomal protein S12 methylthiotransferase